MICFNMSTIKNTNLALEVLVVQVVDVATGKCKVKDPALNKLMKNIKIILKNNSYEYYMATQNLRIDDLYDELTKCSADARMNWGRFVAIFALLYVYADQNRGDDDKLWHIRRIFTKFLLKDVAPWIRNQGGISNYVYPCKHQLLYFLLGVMLISYLYEIDDS